MSGVALGEEFLLKVVVVGNMGVGKTSLLRRFIDDEFSDMHVTTIGVDFKMRILEREGYDIRMQIWDTAGMDRFRTIVSSFYRGAHGLIVVYDVTDRSSFEKILWWVQEAQYHTTQKCAGLLVGNKVDRDWERQVTTREGEKLASKLGFGFFETSAKDNQNVQETFDGLADTIMSRQQLGSHLGLQSDPGIVDIRSSEVSDASWCSGDLYSCVML